MVKYEYVKDFRSIEESENIMERRKKHLELYEAEDHLVFSGNCNENTNGFHIMRCLNERKPYEFIQNVKHNHNCDRIHISKKE